MIVLNFDIYEFFASSIKKTLMIIYEKFLLCKKIKLIIYGFYLGLTPSYCAVILD